LVLSGEGGYVGESCALALNFVTVNAYTRPNTTEVDYGYGYYPIQYAPGETVTLTAKTRENHEFKEWSFFSPSSIWSEITDATSSTITFTMPSEPVTVSAEYIDLTLDSDGDGIPDHLDPYPNQSTQIINWNDTDLSLLFIGDNASLNATARTAITYTTSDESVATISGTTLTIVGGGSAVITATAPEDAEWFEATSTISLQTDSDTDGDGIPDSRDDDPYQQSQSIVWNDDLSALSVGQTLTLTASAQTPVSYASSDTSVATISGNTLTLVAEGSVTITATAEASSDYFAATSVVNTYISPMADTPTLSAEVLSDGDIEVTIKYPDTGGDIAVGGNNSLDDNHVYKLKGEFYNDEYRMVKMLWKWEFSADGEAHPDNQVFKFKLSSRMELPKSFDDFRSLGNQKPSQLLSWDPVLNEFYDESDPNDPRYDSRTQYFTWDDSSIWNSNNNELTYSFNAGYYTPVNIYNERYPDYGDLYTNRENYRWYDFVRSHTLKLSLVKGHVLSNTTVGGTGDAVELTLPSGSDGIWTLYAHEPALAFDISNDGTINYSFVYDTALVSNFRDGYYGTDNTVADYIELVAEYTGTKYVNPTLVYGVIDDIIIDKHNEAEDGFSMRHSQNDDGVTYTGTANLLQTHAGTFDDLNHSMPITHENIRILLAARKTSSNRHLTSYGTDVDLDSDDDGKLDILSNFTCTQEGSKIRITFPCFTSNSRGKDTSQGPHHIALWENTNGNTSLWQDPDWQTRTDGEIVSVLLDLDVDRVYYSDPSQAPIDKTQLLEFELYTTKPGTSNYLKDRTIYRESDWHINYVP